MISNAVRRFMEILLSKDPIKEGDDEIGSFKLVNQVDTN